MKPLLFFATLLGFGCAMRMIVAFAAFTAEQGRDREACLKSGGQWGVAIESLMIPGSVAVGGCKP
jgi:hypothetical protein